MTAQAMTPQTKAPQTKTPGARTPQPGFAPRPTAPGLRCGITDDMTTRLVHAFYARVRQDPLLGPVFEGAIPDWDAHLAKLVDFWSSVTLMTGRYKGRPVPAHVGLPGIGPEMFARWLGLFRQTALEECPSGAVAL